MSKHLSLLNTHKKSNLILLFIANFAFLSAQSQINQKVLNYCTPSFDSGAEAISFVGFAGIENTSEASEYLVSDEYEDFTNIEGNVKQGETYTLTIKGNTVGDYTNHFKVYIDWNQNGSFEEEGEAYEITETLTNSDGEDNQQVSQEILVPTNALVGNTRMRVMKKYTDVYPGIPSCNYQGQAEDYTLIVSEAGALGIDAVELSKNAFVIYPNPVKDYLNIKSEKNISSIKIYDLSGSMLKSFNHTNSININDLKSGVYLVQVQDESGVTNTQKITKK